MKKVFAPLILVTAWVALSALLYSMSIASPDPGEIWAVDRDGTIMQVFNPGDPVYVKGVGLKKGLWYKVYIFEDRGTELKPGDYIPSYDPIHPIQPVDSEEIQADLQNGFFGPQEIWPQAQPGSYDVFADCLEYGTVGVYEPGTDAKDEENLIVATAGFFVIPDLPLGTLSVLFAGFSAMLMIARKRIP